MINPVKKKTETKTMEFWSCGLDSTKGHHHTTRKIAEKCFNKRKHRSENILFTGEYYTKRDAKIAARWIKVNNFAQVSREFNLSTTRVYQIVARELRRSRPHLGESK